MFEWTFYWGLFVSIFLVLLSILVLTLIVLMLLLRTNAVPGRSPHRRPKTFRQEDKSRPGLLPNARATCIGSSGKLGLIVESFVLYVRDHHHWAIRAEKHSARH